MRTGNPAGKLLASPGETTPTEPQIAWPDDMDIAVLANWSEHETTIKVVKSGHSWAGLRSFVPDAAPVVGFDTDVPDLFCLAGQGGCGSMMAPELAKFTVDLCTSASGVRTDLFGQALSPQRLL